MLAWLALTLSPLLVGGWVAQQYFPLEIAELSNRYQLWKTDVREMSFSNGLTAYSRNLCRPSQPCHCVALVHGLGDSAMTWKRLLVFPKDHWPLHSGEGIHLYAFDLPGSGRTPPPMDPQFYGVREQARVLKDALEAECPKWTLVGNSLGGWITAWVAHDWPGGVKRLVLLDAAGFQLDEDPTTFADPSVASLREFQRRAYFHPRELPSSVWNEVVRKMRSGNSRAVLKAQHREDFLTRRILRQIQAPTTIIWGEADQVLPREFASRFSREIPKARLKMVQECGHLPQKECPLPVIETIALSVRH